MKRLLMACFVALAAWSRGEEAYRVFTDLQGRTIEARIVDSKPDGSIEVERRNGQKAWVQPDVFSAEDRAYVRAWRVARLFLSDRNLRITADEVRNGQELHYTLTLENRTDLPIRGLKIKYCIFIEVKQLRGGEDSVRRVHGFVLIDQVPPHGRVDKKTEKVMLERTYAQESVRIESGPPITNKVKQSEVKEMGVWFKVSGPALESEPLARDVCLPSWLRDKVEWTDAPPAPLAVELPELKLPPIDPAAW